MSALSIVKKKPSYLAKIATNTSNSWLRGVPAAAYLDSITLDGKCFMVHDGDEKFKANPSDALKCVIIAAKTAAEQGGHDVQRHKFEKKWKKGAENKVQCFSDDGLVPASRSADAQNSNCVSCKWNRMGTDLAGGDGKACRLYKTLVIVPFSDGNPVVDEESGEINVYRFNVPLTSLKNLNIYAEGLADDDIPAEAMVTEITFEDGEKHPKLVFERAGYLTQEAFEALATEAESEIVQNTVKVAEALDGGTNVDDEEEEEPAKKTTKKKKKKPVVVADPDDEDEEEEEEEPVKKTVKKKKKKKKPVAVVEDDIEDDFDEDEESPEEESGTDEDDDDDDLLGDLDGWDDIDEDDEDDD